MSKTYKITFEVESYAIKSFVELLGKITEIDGVLLSTNELENQKIQKNKKEKKENGK